MTSCVTVFIQLEMEGKKDKYSVATWENSKKEKKNAHKREYYQNNQEKLAEKARERMRRLCENRKLQGGTSLKDMETWQHVLHRREEFHAKKEQIKSALRKLKEKEKRKERNREKNIKEDKQKSEFANLRRKENLPMMQDRNRKEIVQVHQHFLHEWLRKGLGRRSPPCYRNHPGKKQR